MNEYDKLKTELLNISNAIQISLKISIQEKIGLGLDNLVEKLLEILTLFNQSNDSRAYLQKNGIILPENMTNKLYGIYKDKKEYNKAIRLCNKTIEFAEKYSNDEVIGISYLNIGSMYEDLNDFSNAIQNYNLAKEKFLKIQRFDYLAMLHSNMSILYKRMDQIENAIAIMEKGVEYAIKSKDPRLLQNIRESFSFLKKEFEEKSKNEDSIKNKMNFLGNKIFQTNKKKENIVSLSYSWSLDPNCKEKYLIYCANNGNTWIPIKINDLRAKIFISFLNLDKIKNINYYFKGITEDNSIIIDDNDGKYYQISYN